MKFLCSSLLGLMLLGSAQAQSCGGAPEAGSAASPAPNETVAPRLTTLPLPEFLLKLNAASETADAEIWAEAMRRLAQPEQHESLLQALRRRSAFPKAPMVGLLAHAELAVRMGALELLETTAGGDHGFDPWAPDSDASTAALAFFKTWATGQEAVTLQLPVLSQSQALTWLREIISGVSERETHGLRSLEAYREQALVQVQQFATSQPDLDSKAGAKLQSARYRLLLSEVVHDGAGALAQQLVFGNRDQQLSSLGQLKKLGPKMLPIVREFVSSKDALIRETAVDVFLELGKAPALEVLHDQLRAETDRNVLQATMRQLGDLATPKSAELLMEWAQRDDEDLIVAALDSLTKIKFGGGDDDSLDPFAKGTAGKASAKSSLKLLEGLLSHASWRVRASVLQAASKLKFKALAPKVRPLLEDADEFVRAAAVSCMGEFSDKPGLKQLQKLFETDSQSHSSHRCSLGGEQPEVD